ncbi:coenzyme F420-0:L-glutamate ligase [Macrococcus carouselicus]|uniref:Glutamate ligase n=1 Tax=Macrococcus carouselicus TaxID=69969 RepID=A0A9Q8CGT2_9STAP|nr:coenzyme F420-0:L-glutamate ligase [Macrococcus carouselicus]TDL95504.1 glutamate ligase [Macrococcus carouselicus]
MIKIQEIPNMPQINIGDNISEKIIKALKESNIILKDNSIICIASKVISISENRICNLNQVEPSNIAYEINKKIPRKDPKVIQKIIDVTDSEDGVKVEVLDNYIGAWLPNGLKLTSGGVDKYDHDKVVLLPENPDMSAKKIGDYIYKKLNKKVAIVITDSDGRIDKMGATQISIGIYGINPLRVVNIDGKTTSETICDMIAASAGLIMGQRGNNKPAVLIEGFEFEFNNSFSITDAIVNR